MRFLIFHNPYTGFFKKLHRKLVGIVPVKNNLDNTGVYYQLCTQNTWLSRNIHYTAFNACPRISRLGNRILLRMRCTAYFMALPGRDVQLITQTANIITVLAPDGRAVISCCKNSFVFTISAPTCLLTQVDLFSPVQLYP